MKLFILRCQKVKKYAYAFWMQQKKSLGNKYLVASKPISAKYKSGKLTYHIT